MKIAICLLGGIEIIAVGTKELHTARLLLREIRISDADDLFCGWLLGKTQDEARNVVENMIKYNGEPMNYHWVLEYHGRVIGRIKGWEVNPKDEYVQLGYDVAEAYRSQGFMTEALCSVCRYVLKQAGFHRVFCTVRETNLPSIRVCEKAGLVLDGIFREHFRQPDGTFVDARVYSLLSNEISEEPFQNHWNRSIWYNVGLAPVIADLIIVIVIPYIARLI